MEKDPRNLILPGAASLVAALALGAGLPASIEAARLDAGHAESTTVKDRENPTLVKVGTIALGHRKVTFFDQKGIKLPQAYRFSSLKQAARNVDRIGEMGLTLNFSMTDLSSGGNIPLPVEVSQSGGSHVIDVFKDPATLIQETHDKNPPSPDVSGYTQFDPLDRRKNVTYLAPPKQKYEEPGLRHDIRGISTENCNNLIDLKFSDAAQKDVKAMTHNIPAQLRVLYRFAYESACNSYGYMVASKAAHRTYEHYVSAANHSSLNFIKGIAFPLIAFPKRAWNSIH